MTGLGLFCNLESPRVLSGFASAMKLDYTAALVNTKPV
jgi:hypothetical protein